MAKVLTRWHIDLEFDDHSLKIEWLFIKAWTVNPQAKVDLTWSGEY